MNRRGSGIAYLIGISAVGEPNGYLAFKLLGVCKVVFDEFHYIYIYIVVDRIRSLPMKATN